MNDFKEKFSQLLLRYGSPDTNLNNKISEVCEPLTNEEIVSAIQEVVRATFKINLQNLEESALKTPANEIVITTPNAPDVLRVDYNQNNTLHNRSKFLEALGTEHDDNYLKSCNLSSLSNYSDEVTELSDNKSSVIETDTIKHKKTKNDITLPNKAKLNITYVRGAAMLNKSRKEIPKLGSATNITMYMVEEVYKNAVKVTKKLDDLKELLSSEGKSNQRLSAIMRMSAVSQQQQQQCRHPQQHQHHQQQTAASIQRAKAMRRYVHVQQAGSDAPATPTSSRSSLIPSKPLQPQKKSLPKAPDKRSLEQPNRTLGLGESNKTSANPPRNAKYAHVQSTIPKPTASFVKRKPQ